ncbi:hypothetical protein AVEN_112204-1 [Araneus ventricosus]|uniref:Uncharacterized protein n=1 Tax=Araneus ventricosus TaxID=182803 RepID=A0A4Y2NQK7_ARAVE|nr:hypothetical protein AVEN_112204-1 [Araneus ventricosus]
MATRSPASVLQLLQRPSFNVPGTHIGMTGVPEDNAPEPYKSVFKIEHVPLHNHRLPTSLNRGTELSNVPEEPSPDPPTSKTEMRHQALMPKNLQKFPSFPSGKFEINREKEIA